MRERKRAAIKTVVRDATLTPPERAEATQEILRGEGWELRREGAVVRDRLTGIYGGGKGQGREVNKWMVSLQEMRVLSVRSYGSCNACFSKGGNIT